MGRRPNPLNPEDPLHAFAIELRALRDSVGAAGDVRATCKAAGITRGTYYAWLSGKQLPGRDALQLAVSSWGGDVSFWLSRRRRAEESIAQHPPNSPDGGASRNLSPATVSERAEDASQGPPAEAGRRIIFEREIFVSFMLYGCIDELYHLAASPSVVDLALATGNGIADVNMVITYPLPTRSLEEDALRRIRSKLVECLARLAREVGHASPEAVEEQVDKAREALAELAVLRKRRLISNMLPDADGVNE